MDLLTELGEILSTGHRLKTLVIDFNDKDLALHVKHCWTRSRKCDFRDHLKEALNNMRSIRGVGCVTIRGVPAILALELKQRMESKPLSLLDFPAEIRNQIYEDCADWSDITPNLVRTIAAWTDHKLPPPYPPRTTPTILLLNRQITQEASSILRTKPLNVTCPYDHDMQKQAEVPNMLRFITSKTLRHVEHINIRIDSWEWIYSLDMLIPALAADHNLKSLRFVFRDCLKQKFLRAQTKKYPDQTLHLSLSSLLKIRGIDDVTIEGDLPDVYAKPMMQIMQSPVGVTDLPTMQALCGNGELVDADAEGD